MTQLPKTSTATGVYLCHFSDLNDTQARGFDPWKEGRDTVIALIWQSEIRVFRNNCPHYDVPMQYRKDRFMSGDRKHIICFAHGALFLPENGKCVLGPCLGRSLDRCSVKTDELGNVWIQDTISSDPITSA